MPEMETTPFLLEYRVTKDQLGLIEWGMTHGKIPQALAALIPGGVRTPEEFMQAALLPHFMSLLRTIATARSKQEAHEKKAREAAGGGGTGTEGGEGSPGP